jgi:hypothetical protein
MMNDELGMAIGSQTNVVWVEPEPIIRKAFKLLTPIVKRSGYVGPVDINVIISNGNPYFLEFSPRFGYDALFCLMDLLDDDITDFLSRFQGNFKEGFIASQRITIPPFPYDDDFLIKKFAADVPVHFDLNEFWGLDIYQDDGLKCAGSDGIIGIATGYGETIGKAVQVLHRHIKKDIKIDAYLQYRTDTKKVAEKRYGDLYG